MKIFMKMNLFDIISYVSTYLKGLMIRGREKCFEKRINK